MPFLKIQSNQELVYGDQLIARASQLIANLLGKPEKYVMITLEHNQQMLFGGSDKPMFYCELKSIGLTKEQINEISTQLMEFLSQETGVAAERIYIEFKSVEKSLWGWNGATF